jgi:predicted PurR-regulated permease PerM
MLGIDRYAARFAWTVALLALALYLAYLVRATVFVFILAVLFAYLLAPLVDLLDRVLPTRNRTPALALAYVIFVAAVGVAGFEVGSRAIDQAKALGKDLPAKVEQWKTQPSSGLFGKYKTELLEKAQAEFPKRASELLGLLPEASAKVIAVASNLIYVVIIPVLAFFMLKDGREARVHILGLVAEGPRRAMFDGVLKDLDSLLAHYMRALVLLSLASFTAFSIFFSIAGMPYGILLAAVAGLLEVIPMLGPVASCIIITLVAVASGSNVAAVVIFLLAYRMFQDYVLSPHLMGQGVELHPMLVLFGVFAGAEIAGIPGTFLSVPVLALARIVYVQARRVREAANSPMVEPAAVVKS